MISDKNKFLFIHIPRTAGTSIEKVLSKYSRPLLGRKDKLQKFSDKHRRLDQYYVSNIMMDIDIKEYNVFSIVREPLSRMKSIFKWGKEISVRKKNRGWSSNTFNEWVHSGEWKQGVKDKQKRYLMPAFDTTQVKWISLDKVEPPFMARWFKFENLDTEWKNICELIGIKEDLPRVHFTSRRKIESSNSSENIIRDYFKEDYEKFSY